MKALFAAALVLGAVALAGCTVHQTAAPGLSGPSDLGLSIRVTALPDSISQDGGSQSSIQVTAIGPDGKPKTALPLRMDMFVGGVGQDYGTLSARTIVTNSSGVASVVYTAPPSPTAGIYGTCKGLPGNCVQIAATATGSGFDTAAPELVTIRLVPPGVILPPASNPTAQFTVTPSSPSASAPAAFDASTSCPGQAGSTGACLSSNNVLTGFNWTFGDGKSGSGQSLQHAYSLAGTYNVTLTVTNDRGLTASATKQVTVGAGSLPTATFTVSPAAAGVNEPVFFNASTSTAGAGHTIASYAWTFGDGATKTGVTATHDYGTAGTYSVQLTVTDEAGQSSTSAPTTVTVGNPPSPTANFSFSPSAPVVDQAVTFDASTSTPAVGPGGQPIVSYTWTFGDNTAAQTTSSPTFSHTFGLVGTYSVTLVVRDSAGRVSPSTVRSVGVVTAGPCVPGTSPQTPCATVTVSQSPATVNTSITLTAMVSSVGTGATSITNYQWDFGDGTPQIATAVNNVNHTYTRSGTFTVKVTLTNDLGRFGSATITILVQ